MMVRPLKSATQAWVSGMLAALLCSAGGHPAFPFGKSSAAGAWVCHLLLRATPLPHRHDAFTP
jgi:hypothetical protein